MELNVMDVDWKNLLIKKYRNYDLDETDCMVIFVSDAILNVQPHTLITKEILSPYMKNSDAIDESLSRLISKKIIVLKNDNNSFYTSIDEFKNKLFEDMIKDISLKHNNPKESKLVSDSLYSIIEEIAKRTLSPLERDRITSWVKSGADEGMIKEACQRSLTKSGNISFKMADKLILELQRSQSRKDIGASMVNEQTLKREELRKLFMENDWTYHGDK